MEPWRRRRGMLASTAIRLQGAATGRHTWSWMDRLARDQWTGRDEMLARQHRRLCDITSYAYRNVPYYRRVFETAGVHPADVEADPGAIVELPLLTRSMIIDRFDDLTTDEPSRRRRLRRMGTSGSTGEPLVFLQDPATRDLFMAYVHHHLTWGGWKLGDPHVYIGGSSADLGRGSCRERVLDRLLNRYSANAYAFSPERMEDLLRRIVRDRPILLHGYASSLYEFARFVDEHHPGEVRFTSIFSFAEVLHDHQRQVIERVFRAPVQQRYATRELGELGAQCSERTGFHLATDNALVEIVDDGGRPLEPGRHGHVVVTSLANFGMPFIRYRIADVAARADDRPCPCGRRQPMISLIRARENEVFRALDGRLVWDGADRVLWDVEGVETYQLVQRDHHLVIVRVVRSGGLPATVKRDVTRALRRALGPGLRVEFEFPTEIPVDASGKRRSRICEIPERGPTGFAEPVDRR